MSPKNLPQASSSILKKFYPNVKSLQAYLNDILEPSENASCLPTLHDNDSVGYKALLCTSYVAIKEIKSKKYRMCSSMLGNEMREVLDQAQRRLFKNKRPQNIITSGYRLANAGDHGKNGMARMGITNYFINTVITAFQAPEWATLLHRIGEEAMLHLLVETSIFVALPNGCCCQLSGEPMIYMTPKNQDAERDAEPHKQNDISKRKRSFAIDPTDQDERQKKRRKLDGSAVKMTAKKMLLGKSSSPADIVFTRVRLFYSKPDYLPHTDHILVGLPSRHIFNRLFPSYAKDLKLQRTSDKYDHQIRQQAAHARHISKYIFPRQYGLDTVFGSATMNSGSAGLGDYLDREFEIKAAGPCKTPKRLKDILPLLEQLLRRHIKCGYVPLRDRACPSKIKNINSKELDSSIILELMSESSIQLRSQISLGNSNTSHDSAGNPIQALGLSQARKYARSKPRFTEFSCSYVEVYRYVALVTKAIIPKTFWGSKANLRVILRYVKEFVSCRRHETLSLHYILQNFSISACEWLSPPGQQQPRVSVSDCLKRRELLEDFLFWYFDSFVLPLLKTTFYVTESSAFRNQVLYFRHDDWATLCAPLIERLTSVTFAKLSDHEAAEILRQRKLGFSFVRLLPKETGVRPIVNLRRKKTVKRGTFTTQQSINQILQAAFAILTYERTNQPDLIGASTFSRNDVYHKLKKLKAALPRSTEGALPKLYFVKVDVQACFDTIEQTKLLQILRQLISEDVYMMQKYGQVNMSLGKIKRNYVRKAVPEDEHPHFLRQAADLANVLQNTIFVDQVVYPLSKKQELLELLEEHITENIVKIGPSYYRQIVGIPQGSVLSSILCSFFYGDLERKFSKFIHDPHSGLLRVVDDYLFITADQRLATEFLDIMNKGHPEYGCFISPDKTLLNFDYDDRVMNVVNAKEQTFPWCGYSINMRDLSVTVDYTRYHGCGVRSTLTVDRGRRAGAMFSHKLLQLAKAKSHAIFADRELNTEDVVYLNIYQNLLLTAMKMHAYIRDWGATGKRNVSFLRNVIEKTIMYNYTTVRGQARRKRDQRVGETSDIRREAIVWLGMNAFYHILSRQGGQYSALVTWLRLEMRRAKYHFYQRRFKKLAKEAQVVFTQVPW